MTSLCKSTVFLLGASVLAVFLPATTAAATRHRVDFTLTDARVVDGSPSTFAGVLSGRPFGSGAVVQKVTVISSTPRSAVTTSTFTLFTARGTLTGTGTSTRTAQPNGGVAITADRTITGGSGVYRRASGHLTVTGSTSQQGVSSTRWAGSLRY